MNMNTTFVEFNLNTLEKNINELKEKCKDVEFLFPVKCCTNRKVLNIVEKLGLGFDVSNQEEYRLIKKYDLKEKFISASGPLSFTLLNQQNVHVVVNNIELYDSNVGIRVNFNDSNEFEESHFGTNIQSINENIRNTVEYIHFHNSDKRTIDKCNSIKNQIKNIIKNFPNIKYLNIGGHLEDLTKEQGIKYINEVREIVPTNIKLIVEVGDFLFKNCGKLYTRVVDSKINENKQIIILNFSKMANQRWVYPELIEQQNNNCQEYETIFYGCSCCEVDIFLEARCKKYNIGEFISFSNISPYSYEWNNSFNGVKKIKFYFKHNGEEYK